MANLVGFGAQCLLNSVMIGILGFMVWTFAAMSLAAADRSKQAVADAEQLAKESCRPAAA
jgi:hypothetical protein